MNSYRHFCSNTVVADRNAGNLGNTIRAAEEPHTLSINRLSAFGPKARPCSDNEVIQPGDDYAALPAKTLKRNIGNLT